MAALGWLLNLGFAGGGEPAAPVTPTVVALTGRSQAGVALEGRVQAGTVLVGRSQASTALTGKV